MFDHNALFEQIGLPPSHSHSHIQSFGNTPDHSEEIQPIMPAKVSLRDILSKSSLSQQDTFRKSQESSVESKAQRPSHRQEIPLAELLSRRSCSSNERLNMSDETYQQHNPVIERPTVKEISSLQLLRPTAQPLITHTTTERSQSRAQILQINIEVRPGVTESVVVHEGERADVISRAFAQKFGLSESIEFALREQIMLSLSKSNLMSSFKEDLGSSDEEGHKMKEINSLDSKKWSNGKAKAPIKIEGVVFANAGERLYHMGQKHKRQQQDILERQRHHQVLCELDDATFHPVTSNQSKRTNKHPEDNLILKGQLSKIKKQQLAEDLQKRLDAENTFKPKIDSRSNQIAIQRQSRMNAENLIDSSQSASIKFDTLYTEANRRKQKQAQANLNAMFSHQPMLIAGQPRQLASFDQRMHNDIQNRRAKTPQPVPDQHPTLNAQQLKLDQRQQQISQHGNVFTYLHTRRYQPPTTVPQEFQSHKITPQSEYLSQQRITTQLQLLFEELAHEGVIDGSNVNLDNISKPCQHALQPLLRELSNYNESLNKDEFVASCLKLIKFISLKEKNDLINFRPAKVEQTVYPYQPTISAVSKAILDQDELYQLPVEDRLLARGKHRDMIRRQKQNL